MEQTTGNQFWFELVRASSYREWTVLLSIPTSGWRETVWTKYTFIRDRLWPGIKWYTFRSRVKIIALLHSWKGWVQSVWFCTVGTGYLKISTPIEMKSLYHWVSLSLILLAWLKRKGGRGWGEGGGGYRVQCWTFVTFNLPKFMNFPQIYLGTWPDLMSPLHSYFARQVFSRISNLPVFNENF